MQKPSEFNEFDTDLDRKSWPERLAGEEPILLDGATGTELERRGLESRLPLWSTHALIESPETVEAVHRDYVMAGADVLTAATFRTQEHVLARARDLGHPVAMTGRGLCARAVDLARSAARTTDRQVFVFGSAAPLEDCYRPDLVPNDRVLAREHNDHAENLAHAGVDAILIETMNCQREALASCQAAARTGLPFLLSFVSWQAGALLSGESLGGAIDACLAAGPSALLVNCLPPSAVDGALGVLESRGLPFGLYANLGAPTPEGGARSEDQTPDAFAAQACEWLSRGAQLVGGCCGTTPDHIAAICRLGFRSRR